jgi:glycosyltransferase involved in cell wall biosynthesis
MADFANRWPLVSVAMPTYNHEPFITQAIESVLAQRTNFSIELVVGDDASADGTARCIEAQRARAPDVVRPIIRPANIGMHRNVEGVLAECRGEFVAFLEGDDFWIADDKLQIQVDTLRACTNVVGVFHPAMVVDASGRDTGKVYGREIKAKITTRDWLEGNLAPTASVMLRRSALGPLPDGVRELKMRDWPMWIFASLHGSWRCLPRVMAAWRVHDGGAWNGLSRGEQRLVMMAGLDFLETHLPSQFSKIIQRQLARLHLEMLEEALCSGRSEESRSKLRDSARFLPYYRLSDSKRLASAFWEALSPRTHRRARVLLGRDRKGAEGYSRC